MASPPRAAHGLYARPMALGQLVSVLIFCALAAFTRSAPALAVMFIALPHALVAICVMTGRVTDNSQWYIFGAQIAVVVLVTLPAAGVYVVDMSSTCSLSGDTLRRAQDCYARAKELADPGTPDAELQPYLQECYTPGKDGSGMFRPGSNEVCENVKGDDASRLADEIVLMIHVIILAAANLILGLMCWRVAANSIHLNTDQLHARRLTAGLTAAMAARSSDAAIAAAAKVLLGLVTRVHGEEAAILEKMTEPPTRAWSA
jgi:hypothetical protein